MHIYPAKDIRTIDRWYMQTTGVTEQVLIDRAAGAFVQAFVREEEVPGRVLVVAGPGNNGADALSIARLLREKGWKTDLWDFSGENSPEEKAGAWTGYLADLPPGIIVIDGLFGSGLTRPVTGSYARIIEGINSLKTRVYAVDIPSGLPGDRMTFPGGAIVCASATFTFQFPKLSFFFAENYPYVGHWEVLDIGMGGIQYPVPGALFRMTEESYVSALFPRKRHPFSHKNDYGHALLIAGSKGKMGAAILAARACLRMGAGLLTVHVPSCGETAMYTALPEAMLSLDSRSGHAGDMPVAPGPGNKFYSAIGAGPGLGKDPDTVRLLEQLLDLLQKEQPSCRLVLDADAINIVSGHPRLLSLIPPGTVLTPHPGEFDRLARACGETQAGSGHERAMQAVGMARERKLVIVLKGRFSLTATPDGPHWFNPTGNPGMATAGSGDVLTGVILGLLAQGYEPAGAAVLGAYLHGLAGDKAAGVSSVGYSFIAGDIIKNL